MYESRGYWEIQQIETEAKEAREAAGRKAEQSKKVAQTTHSGTVVDKEGWTTVVGRGR